MNERRKSDGSVVPGKLSNKEGSRRGASGYGEPYTGTKAETPDTDKGAPTGLMRRTAPTAEAVEGRGPTKGNSDQTNRSRTQGRTDLSQRLARVREVAQRDKGERFTALLHHVYDIERLRGAYLGIERGSAPGVDGVTWQEYGRNLEENLRALSERLKRGSYRAQSVRRVYIPKADGRMRPLGVPALEDKIVQRSTVEVLNAVYETDFLGFSYGFRPGRSQHNALDALAVGIQARKVSFVLDADIRGFFDSISHEWMMRFIEHRIADERLQRFIRKWLKAGVLEDGQVHEVGEGTPQGGSVSPLLANIYLHYVLDLWVQQWRRVHARGEVIIVRYADDFVMGFQYRSDAEAFRKALEERLRGFNLALHPEKTRLLEFGRFAAADRRRRGEGKPETFNFLGFTHCCGRTRNGGFQVRRRTIRKRFQAKLQALKAELRRRWHRPRQEVGAWLRAVVRGHYQYYGVPGNYDMLTAFRWHLVRLWRRALLRQSQRSRFTWSRAKRLADYWLPLPRLCHPHPARRLRVAT